MDRIGCIGLAHFHVIVEDLDEASAFYREVLDFVEMQSHHDLENRGLAMYYGIVDDPERFRVSLRFMAWPGVLTMKLVKVDYAPYKERRLPDEVQAFLSGEYWRTGSGPVSVVVADLDATYQHLLKFATDYESRFRVKLLSEPVFLSPLLPHQIGTTKHSVLRGHREILDDLAEKFPQRAKFQMIDPFGVRWEFNNNVDAQKT